MKSKNLRIAFLTSDDPTDKRSWSGIPYYMLHALKRAGADVQPLGPVYNPLKPFGQVANKISRHLLGKRYNYKHSLHYSKQYARIFKHKLQREGSFDLIFAPAASTEIAYLDTDIPIFYTSDATFHIMHEYYDAFSSVFKSIVRQNEEIESRAINKATTLIYPSEWAANSAIHDYGASPENIHIIPYGANLDREPSREEALKSVGLQHSIELLFIGVDWERKGGAVAFHIANELNSMGLNTNLTIIGCNPPLKFQKDFVKVFPYLDKNDPEQFNLLTELYLNADIFILPTQMECYGIVFCEACAFGLPILATNTGGVATIVKEGENGFLFKPDAKPEDYMDKIVELKEDNSLYMKMRRQARDRYESSLNWEHWGQKLTIEIESIL